MRMLWLTLSGVMLGGVLHAQTPEQWLNKMGRAVEDLNYYGQFIHIQGDTVENLQIVHRVDEHGSHERLYSLDGVGREILRDQTFTHVILPDRKVVIIEPNQDASALKKSLPQYSNELAKYYALRLMGEERVVNRVANILDIDPNDDLRYGYRLWLDQATAMPLRAELTNQAGDVLERVVFTELTMSSTIDDVMLKPVTNLTGFQMIRREPQEALLANAKARARDAAKAWRVADMPDGFSLSVVKQTRMGDQRKVEHYVFTDGLATVSMFIEAMPNNLQDLKARPVLSRMGIANAYAYQRDGYQITMVGEVPPATVEMMGASVMANNH